MKYPQELQDLIDSFMILPGIGPKTAERLALFIALKTDKEKVEKFSKSLLDVSNNIKTCKICGNITNNEICDICNDNERDKEIIVVENCKEVITFEKTKRYHGKYHVLNGLISPMNGVNAEDTNISQLVERIDDEGIKKVIIATSATIPGEMTAMYIKNILENKEVEVFRIGYGLPVGGDIEYADEITLLKALEGIKKF